MSDPLSVAGSAVGIVSLGIQVCQGLVSYLRSVQGRQKDIANYLREVQSLVSVFHSLNDVLPRLSQQQGVDHAVIQRCLFDCKDELVKLQLLVLKLRGPSNPSDIKGKMKETGRVVLYPFREGELASVRQSLQSLLGNLSLAINIVSLKSDVSQSEAIEAVRTAIEGVDVASNVTIGVLRDLRLQIQENSNQLELLDNGVLDSLDSIKGTVDRTEWVVRDLEQSVNGKFTVVQTDMRSIESNSLVTSQAITELLTKMDGFSEQMSGLAIQLSQTRGSAVEHLRADVFRPRLPSSDVGASTRGGRMLWTRPCHCPPNRGEETYRYSIWALEFHLKQQRVLQHREGCKFHGITRKKKTTLRAQFPVAFGQFLGRFNRACVEYTAGAGRPGVTLRFINIVPISQSPFLQVFLQMLGVSERFGSQRDGTIRLPIDKLSQGELVDRLEETEKALISLYRDRKSSPWDLTENGESHAALLFNLVLSVFRSPANHSQWIVKRALQLLQVAVPVRDSTVDESDLPRLPPGSLYHMHHILYQLKDNREGWEESETLLSYGAQNFKLDPQFILDFGARDSVPLLLTYFANTVSGLTPIARAILLRSMQNLDCEIALQPEAVTETVGVFTTLQLCVGWPGGLQRLLKTTAREFIDVELMNVTPIRRALRLNCHGSVELLMKAGCVLDFDPDSDFDILDTSKECVAVIASNLAERRRDLLRLCQDKLGIYLDWDPRNVPDEKAASLCTALIHHGIPVPRHLSVSPDYATIFHFPGLSFAHFHTFWGAGFQGARSHNALGLTPIMTWRQRPFQHAYVELSTQWEEMIFERGRWAQGGRHLDQTQEDPLCLGLNTFATGWHYMAAALGFTFMAGIYMVDKPLSWIINRETPIPHRIVNNLSQSMIQDHCVCWCNPQGQGCSALKSLWKAHADWRETDSAYANQAVKVDMFWRHCLIHNHHETKRHNQNTDANSIGTLAMELVRLLIFEVLDMTHTCCYLEQVKNLREEQTLSPAQRKTLSIKYNWDRRRRPNVIANCNSQVAEEIRSDSLEQQNANQLNELMNEFEPQILRLDFSDPKALHKFI